MNISVGSITVFFDEERTSNVLEALMQGKNMTKNPIEGYVLMVDEEKELKELRDSLNDFIDITGRTNDEIGELYEFLNKHIC